MRTYCPGLVGYIGYLAVLLTDTAFYRNQHYHKPTNTLNRLDIRQLGLAVEALLAVVIGR